MTQPRLRGNRYRPLLPIVIGERFMMKHMCAYGGHHNVPAIMYRSSRNKYNRGKKQLKPIVAYQWR